MHSTVRPGNVSVATCISSAAVSSLTLLISAHLALALCARAFPNRLRQYVSHESAIRPLERRFRLLFYASMLMVVDSMNHMFYFGSLWLFHEADPLVYRVIYVITSSTANPLIVFAIVHRCIFIVGQNCPRRRWRLLAIAFMLCLGVSLAVGFSGAGIIGSLLEAGPRNEHAELWSTSPYVSSEVTMVIIILPALVLGASVWALAYLVRTSTGAQGEQLPPAPRISVMSMVSSAASSSNEPSQNTLSDSGNQLNSTAYNINAQTCSNGVCTTVLPSLDGVDTTDKSRSADILSNNPFASQLSKMVKRATSSSLHLKSLSPTTVDPVGPITPAQVPVAPSTQQLTSPTHTATPSQQLAYPLSRSFLILTLLLTLLWIGVLGIASQGPFIGPIRSATLMSLLGVLGCWVDASFESLARVAAKRQNEQSWETVSAHFSFFSTIRQTLGRAMSGGSRRESRRESEQAGARRMSNQATAGTVRPVGSPTVLRSAPTCPRGDVHLSNARHHGPGEGHQVTFPSLVKGSSPRTGSRAQVQQVRKGSGQPPSVAEESPGKGSVAVVTTPRKGKGDDL